MSLPRHCIALLCTAVFGATAVAAGDPGVTGYQQGQGATPIQGAAGTGGSTGDSGLEHCDKPMGAVTVVEPQNYVMQALHRYDGKLYAQGSAASDWAKKTLMMLR